MTDKPWVEPTLPDGARAPLIHGYFLKSIQRPDEAIASFRDAIRLAPGLMDAHAALGHSLRERGQLAEAAACFRHAIDIEPDDIFLHTYLGNVYALEGKLDEAAACYRTALVLNPQFLAALFGLGSVLEQQGELGEAVVCYRLLVGFQPSSPRANAVLGGALVKQGELDEAVHYYNAAVALAPDYVEARAGLASVLDRQRAPDKELEQYQRIAQLQPKSPIALGNLGSALAQLGRLQEAIEYFRRSLDLDPSDAAMHSNLGSALLRRREPAEATASYRQALALDPDLADAHFGLADVLALQEQPDEAIAGYRKALALKPDFAVAYGGLGRVLQETGQIDEARSCYERAIALDPAAPRYYWALARVTKLSMDSPYLQTMLRMANDTSKLPDPAKANLNFALGQALADNGEYQRSFEYLVAANAIRRRSVSYDEASVLAGHERAAEIFTPQFIRSHEGEGDPSQLPVFIVGMPRSGTTLVEQILASHRNIFGAGEIGALPEALGALSAHSTLDQHFLEEVPNWSSAQFHQLAGDYLNRLPATAALPRGAQVTRIVDKMMLNYLYIGLIRLALPNARIIHVSRDPIDTCLSCFSIMFNELPFAYDLGELGRRYKAYERLMAHWRSVLPPEAMLEVRYEDLVTHTERESRRMIDYCGLEWDDACLRFFETSRLVRTASNVQVRQPIYRNAIGRWRPDASVLQPLTEALAG